MEELFARFWNDLVGRVGGPLSFRFLLQPVMAMLMAIGDGMSDARANRPAFLWAVFTEPAERPRLIREIWVSVGKIIVLALVLDAVYQFTVLGWIYPGELIVVTLLLAVLPYCLLRGPINRIARWWQR